MNPETPSDEGEKHPQTFKTGLAKLGQIEVPTNLFRWVAMWGLFALGVLLGGGFTLISYAFFGAFWVLMAGMALSICRNRYLMALGLGLLTPIVVGLPLLLVLWFVLG